MARWSRTRRQRACPESRKDRSSIFRTESTTQSTNSRDRSSAKTMRNSPPRHYLVRRILPHSSSPKLVSKAPFLTRQTRGWRPICKPSLSKTECESWRKKMKEWTRKLQKPCDKRRKWVKLSKSKIDGFKWCRKWRRSRHGKPSSRKWRTRK